MKTPILALLLSLLSLPLQAADWENMARNPATIEVLAAQPVLLVTSTEKNGWLKIPDQLTKLHAQVFMPTGPSNGVADIKITADGFLLLACNYDYQGNKQGEWDEERWDERKFKTKGWHLLSKNELAGQLVYGNNREQVVFSKQVKKGETFRVRCNKYDPPFPILLSVK